MAYRTGFTRWRAADGTFSDWQCDGTALAADGTLQFQVRTARPGSDPYPAGSYSGRNYYNGGTFAVGEAISPVTGTDGGAAEAIASWNAETPPGTWIEILLRAQLAERWTKWYSLGVWAADSSTVERHSVRQQDDGDGSVATDTLRLGRALATGFQLKLRLFSIGGNQLPSVRSVGLAVSTRPTAPKLQIPGNPDWWNRTLPVPQCSQMVYRDGGEAWCSPTSVSMVGEYWQRTGDPCEPRVRAAVGGVYDWVYRGHGNWAFNTAYAATQGLEGCVARWASLAQAEPWIDAGVPVVISYGWQRGALAGAPIPASDGHLAVLTGFDAQGDPVVNDPAAAGDARVRRTYARAQLEPLWLAQSGGTVYLIHPPDWPVPYL